MAAILICTVTKEITVYSCLALGLLEFFLIGTPGFDDSHRSDSFNDVVSFSRHLHSAAISLVVRSFGEKGKPFSLSSARVRLVDITRKQERSLAFKLMILKNPACTY